MKCSECLWYTEALPDRGHCRGGGPPPGIVEVETLDVDMLIRWPLTMAIEFCPKFHPRDNRVKDNWKREDTP